MERHEAVYKSRKRMIVDNFIGGIAWSVGVVIGAAIIAVTTGYLLAAVDFVPIVGDFIKEVLVYLDTQ